ncbi:MAG TPA: phage tail protein, partial [Trichocoleus sp.]
MVQSLPPTASLDLVPMRLADVSLAYGAALSPASDDIASTAPEAVNLLLHPGEPDELLLRLRNQTDHPLRFVVRVTGSFPEAWCLSDLEPYEVPAGGRRDVAIAFQAPADFFETLTEALPAASRPLNYSGRLDVYSYTQTDELEGVTSEQLTLLVRPQSPYLKLLPQVYQEIDLVGRLMALVERTFSPSVETWFSLWAYLNPLLAPQAMLGFLAHWVGWRSLPHLTWEQQRQLIHHAVELYSWRGTAYGLRLYLHLATGLPLDAAETPESERHISIVEPSRQGAVFGDSAFHESTVFGGGQGFHFTVTLRPPEGVAVDGTLVRTIIDQERP